MIEIVKLTESDKGRNVIYHREFCNKEVGKLTSWNDSFVFVQFKGPNGEACEPCDVSFEIGTPLSELSGRPGHAGYEEFKRIASSWGYD